MVHFYGLWEVFMVPDCHCSNHIGQLHYPECSPFHSLPPHLAATGFVNVPWECGSTVLSYWPLLLGNLSLSSLYLFSVCHIPSSSYSMSYVTLVLPDSNIHEWSHLHSHACNSLGETLDMIKLSSYSLGILFSHGMKETRILALHSCQTIVLSVLRLMAILVGV